MGSRSEPTFTVLPVRLPPGLCRRNSSPAGEVKLPDVFRSPTVPNSSSSTCELVSQAGLTRLRHCPLVFVSPLARETGTSRHYSSSLVKYSQNASFPLRANAFIPFRFVRLSVDSLPFFGFHFFRFLPSFVCFRPIRIRPGEEGRQGKRKEGKFDRGS